MFGPDVDKVILQEALKTSQEICGIVQNGKVVFLPNESEDPEEHFLLSTIPDDAQAVFHSHPNGPFYPSKLDMEQQYATMIPWGIAAYSSIESGVFWWGDDVPIPELIGRPFRHGVTDCYALIKDFYKLQHGVDLPEYPRSWEWWDEGERLYEDGFTSAGFVEIDSSLIEPGDVFLAAIRSPTSNHGGIYLGNGLILHHTAGRGGYDKMRLSNVEPGSRWFKFLSKVLRYENSPIDRTPGQGVWPRV